MEGSAHHVVIPFSFEDPLALQGSHDDDKAVSGGTEAMQAYTFHKTNNGRIELYDSTTSDGPPRWYLLEVEDNETGRGRGFIIEGDPTGFFYETRHDAAEFLEGVDFRLTDCST